MPTASNRITLEGVDATKRGRDMLFQARVIFYKRTGRMPPRISQGGYSNSVGASAGTHGKEAFDFAVAGWTSYYQKAWEDAMWEVGFADWHRNYIFNLWPEHNHCVPKGGDLSPQAVSQIWSFNNRRDGLAGNRPYPRIGKWNYQTWDKYKDSQARKFKGKTWTINGKKWAQISTVSVSRIIECKNKNIMSRSIYITQIWLKRLGYYPKKAVCDGRWGPVTQKALDDFRAKKLGWKGNVAKGEIGITSLQWLRLYAKSTRLISE